MAEHPTTPVLAEIVTHANRLTSERAAAEERIAEEWERAAGDAERTHQRAVKSLTKQRDDELSSAAHTRDAAIAEANQRFESEAGTTKREYDSKRGGVLEAATQRLEELDKEAREAHWFAVSIYESDIDQAEQRAKRTMEQLASRRKSIEELETYADRALTKLGLWHATGTDRIDRERAATQHTNAETYEQAVESEAEREYTDRRAKDTDANTTDADTAGSIGAAINAELESQPDRKTKKDPSPVDVALESARDRMETVESLPIAKLAQWPWIIALVLILAAGGTTGGWFADGQTLGTMTMALAGAGAALGIVAAIMLRLAAAKSVRNAYADFRSTMETTWFRVAVEERLTELTRTRSLKEIAERHRREIEAGKQRHAERIAKTEAKRDERLKLIDDTYKPRLASAERTRDEAINTARAAYESREQLCTQVFEKDTAEATSTYESTTSEARHARDTAWQAMETAWREGMQALYERAAALTLKDDREALPWDHAAWNDWSPMGRPQPAARFGEIRLDLSQLPGGLPENKRLHIDGPTVLELPAALAVPDAASLLIQFGREGRDAALDLLRAAMLRQLAILPPGKVRFTIIDPVGLGQSFAGFMHLADYNEASVAYRIWTEAKHIEQRLAELTEHMENVIQKYLRNQFSTIAEYNEKAGEIAEPYRFLVISDFPVNFSESTARRLMSIIQSGARCGVYTLIAMDTREKVPGGIDIADIEANATTLAFRDAALRWKHKALADIPLALDTPPTEQRLTRIVQQVGEASIDGTRVEVPFQAVAPPEGKLWSGDSAGELKIPLGRAGATKLQHMTLGRGTAQHVLLAGKTGSGKSTLLHVMITNLALWYGPDQVEFYLVDFKKGVEFKAYATRNIPHARAVAIESDREFGISVLERVDSELKRRGDLFRDAGVQNLAGFREARPDTPMPRTLLIIDEFQELFVEDDKLAQNAALLLDRLVRQGRAFGIHVILGSQTLGGAYGLARSTLGQMAVRIALQCSEADSYLIMNEDNAAARLLSRPGEAIYNDAAGMVEGNNPFQIVWLPDARRDDALQQVEALAQSETIPPTEPTIVFEGNIPADLEHNQRLIAAVQSTATPLPEGQEPTLPAAPAAWLGDAIAIKDPTAAIFRRQSGANLLLLGQRAEPMLGITAAALISLAAQHPPATAQFFVIDPTPEDDPLAGHLPRTIEALPHDARLITLRDIDDTLVAISAEVDRRAAESDYESPAVYLTLFGIQRIRSLRSSGDDFGFSMSDEPETPKPDKLLANILREGPALGVHVIAWCDTLANLERAQDRRAMREYDNRVLLQMSATDSTSLIDTPAAGKLGPNRALFYNEESATIEKFRPYAPPSSQTLERFKAILTDPRSQRVN